MTSKSKIKKVLLIFPNWYGRSGNYCHDAAKSIGLESHLVWGSDHDELTLSGYIRGRIKNAPLVSAPFIKRERLKINENIIRKVRELRPDLTINNCPYLFTGTVEELRKNSKYLACWTGDDPELFPGLMETIKLYDLFFGASPEWLKGKVINLRKGGNHYLPYGSAPEVFRRAVLSSDEREKFGSPVAFVGARYSDREILLDPVKEFDLAIWGWKKDNSLRKIYRKIRGSRHSLFHQKYSTDAELYLQTLNRHIRSGPISNAAANKVYNASEIVLNLQHPQIIRAVNPKTFEISGAGCFQLLQHKGDLLGLYEKEREIVTFETAEEMREKTAYYLKNPGERRAIAERAMKRTNGEHTFAHRMKTIISLIRQ